MKYIVHKRFKKLGLGGRVLNLPYGTELFAENDILYTKEHEPVCARSSENSKIHFAVNDDGMGAERGKYTNAIAYSRKAGLKKTGCRFDPKQCDIITRHYQRFIRPEHDMIIFNERFFRAPVEELKQMAAELGIRVYSKTQ